MYLVEYNYVCNVKLKNIKTVMTVNYLAFAIPAFFIFVFIEFKIAQHQKKAKVFKYESTVANFSVGIAERLLNLFIAASFYQVYEWVYTNYAIFNISTAWYVWVLLLLSTDLVWYWYHRLGHEINFLWAAHIVHHQSEEFNLSAAARITTIQAVFRNVFWCVLPLVGFHPNMIITILLAHGAYSFFTHTQLIGKIGWLENVLITPSLHGVHHASDEKYLDKNYGDVFVFWDKLFGTFQKEEEPPKYGLTHPIKSYSFLWQHFHYYLEIGEAYRRANGFKAKWNAVFGSPALMDQTIRPVLEKRYFQDKKQDTARPKFKIYLNLQLTIVVAMLTATTLFYSSLTMLNKIAILIFILITLINIGALLEQRKWIYYLECFRLILIFGFFFYTYNLLGLLIFPVIILIALERTFSLRKLYMKHVFEYIKV
ncbi:sterol desaturase family protein [Pedobacter soli]|uniref:Sterol desaturase/sphingolipid hydroxylase, fatty acid hydroxylase superfamily n=1 Tax=Pedobacter soli TaxID=390242 RepID=A0A1G6J3Q5_9SPHI|nr:sterol desaturase family protein [Pedobacter soli]SDC13340.1 Sterol desaturase/sphingolipid hydroxylase, fatty acid hydroxylase superfamily [Pedobacter soli]